MKYLVLAMVLAFSSVAYAHEWQERRDTPFYEQHEYHNYRHPHWGWYHTWPYIPPIPEVRPSCYYDQWGRWVCY